MGILVKNIYIVLTGQNIKFVKPLGENDIKCQVIYLVQEIT